MKRVSIITFGCKVNQYESEYMAEKLEEHGFVVVPEEAGPNIFIINSCAVTGTAVRKVQHKVRKIKRDHPWSKVVVVGCYPQLENDDPIKYGADIALGNKEKKEIWKYIENLDKKVLVDKKYWLNDGEVENLAGGFVEKTRAFVKIEDGCDRACTYCAIRFARGTKIRSKPSETVLEEISKMVNLGYKEIVLTGVNLGRYGADSGEDLADLLWKVEKIPGDFRIRLSSLNPEDIGEKILDVFKNSSRICPHLHISLQSGSNRILSLMNRNYTKEKFLKIANDLRSIDPYFSITTDIIVGFPSESDEDFLESVDMVKSVGFSRVHAFRYSQKPGTPAAKMKGQIPGNVKRDRITYLEKVASEVAMNYRRNLVGKVTEVLIERRKWNIFGGYDQYYVYHEIPGGEIGKIIKAKVLSANEEGVVSKRCSS